MTINQLREEVFPHRPRQEYVDRVTDHMARQLPWTPEQVARIKARETWVGADLIATLLALGRPRKWDTTHVAGGRIDYLFYGDPLRGGKLVTLRNGFVQSWSTH